GCRRGALLVLLVPQLQAGGLVEAAAQDHVVERLDHELAREHARAQEVPAHDLDPVVAVAHDRDVGVHRDLAGPLADVAGKIQDLERALEAARLPILLLTLVVLDQLDRFQGPQRPDLAAPDAPFAAHVGDGFEQLDASIEPPHDAAAAATFGDDHGGGV